MSKPVKNINHTPTEAELKKALIALLFDKPLQSITVKELCEKAGIYRSTFYSHYKSPEELFEAIEKEEITKLHTYATTKNIIGKLDTLGNCINFLEYIKENAEIYHALLLTDANHRTYLFFIDEIASQIRNLSDYPNDFYADYLPVYMANGFLFCLIKWIKEDFKTPTNELASFIATSLHWTNEARLHFDSSF